MQSKILILQLIESSSLENILGLIIPVEVFILFKRRFSHSTFEKSQDIRIELISWIEIVFDNLGYKQLFINFPKYNLQQIKVMFQYWSNITSEFKT